MSHKCRDTLFLDYSFMPYSVELIGSWLKIKQWAWDHTRKGNHKQCGLAYTVVSRFPLIPYKAYAWDQKYFMMRIFFSTVLYIVVQLLWRLLCTFVTIDEDWIWTLVLTQEFRFLPLFTGFVIFNRKYSTAGSTEVMWLLMSISVCS